MSLALNRFLLRLWHPRHSYAGQGLANVQDAMYTSPSSPKTSWYIMQADSLLHRSLQRDVCSADAVMPFLFAKLGLPSSFVDVCPKWMKTPPFVQYLLLYVFMMRVSVLLRLKCGPHAA